MFGKSLAHIERIKEIHPIEGADRIERATVLDWNLIVGKGEFAVGDLAVYVEVGSVLPDGLSDEDRAAYDELAKVVSAHRKYASAVEKAKAKGKPIPAPDADLMSIEQAEAGMAEIQKRSSYQWAEPMRARKFTIKTMNLLKFNVISQGILYRPEALGIPESSIKVGADVTELLGITEKVEDAEEAGIEQSEPKFILFKWLHRKLMRYRWYRKWRTDSNEKSCWPSWCPPKSDETNAQKIYSGLLEKYGDRTWVATEKLEGQSIALATRYDNGPLAKVKYLITGKRTKKLYVFSRTRMLPRRACSKMQFWRTVEKESDFARSVLAIPGEWFCRGEHLGPGVQKNIYKLTTHSIRFYDFYSFDENSKKFTNRLNYAESLEFAEKHGLPYVPVIDDNFTLPTDVQDMLRISTGKTVFGNDLKHLREGLVLRLKDDYSVSFKAKSPDYSI